jgi:response regulator RpfG family c-di-GMP phosphodiesterase
MRGMSGLELLEQAARLRPAAARLLITGWPDAVPPERARALGLRALIPKPWDDAELKRALRDALGVAG